MTKTQKASELLRSWQDIRRQLFTPETQVLIMAELVRLKQENIYLELRNTSNKRLLEFIDHLCDLSYPEWPTAVENQPLPIQAFLFDRVNYVEGYLGHLGQAEVSHVTELGDFVKDALVEWWNRRDQEFHP